MRPFYTIPLKPKQLIQKQRHPLAEIRQGVADYIHLILKTHLAEYRYDYRFGCYVWDQDFENIQSISKWENQMETQIKATIERYEKRLEQIDIKIRVEEPEAGEFDNKVPNRFKRRIHINVNGQLWKTRQAFQHQEFIYFSPLYIS